ncbi:MAG: hypothetical protein WAV23_03870 [Minisyncoccia bacterium]
MKKILFILAVLLFVGSSKAQRLQPIQSYNENGYTIDQVKNFLMGTSELSKNYRKEFLHIVNFGLVTAGETVKVDENNIFWVLDHVQYSEMKLEGFTNSGRKGNTIQFYPDKNFQGTVGIFQYGKCKLIIFKTICMNLLEVPVIIQQTAPAPVPSPVVKDDNQYQRVQPQNQNQCTCYKNLGDCIEHPTVSTGPYYYGPVYYNEGPLQRRIWNEPSCGNGFGMNFQAGVSFNTGYNNGCGNMVVQNHHNQNYNGHGNGGGNIHHNSNNSNNGGSYYGRRR